MSYKLVNATQLDEDLTSIADAIRAKTGGVEDLEFPDDFNSEINSLYKKTDFFSSSYPIGAVTSNLTAASQYTYQFILQDCKQITSLVLTQTTIVPASICQGCTGLLSAQADKATLLGNNAFNACSSLTAVAFPKVNSCNTNTFYNCTNLTIVDWGGQGSSSAISANAFNGCGKLNKLILRNATTMTSLSNVNAFSGTPFASGKAGGILYVPSDLIETYQANTNWATILGYGNGEQNQILAIETSPYVTTYGDGRLIANVNT